MKKRSEELEREENPRKMEGVKGCGEGACPAL